VIIPNSREIVLMDGSVHAPVTVVGLVLVGAVAVGAGVMTDGWWPIPLMVIGALLALLGVAIAVMQRVRGAGRLVLTQRGLVYSLGEKEQLVPKEAIEGVGLLRGEGALGITELTLWYDTAAIPQLPKGLHHFARRPGRIRLAVVTDDVASAGLSLQDVKEVRKYVQANGLGEWRNRRA
jgi:hypothetical protein